MKRLNYLLLGLAGLAMASCSQDDLQAPNSAPEARVALTLSTPELATRAYSDGSTVNKLHYSVYEVTTGDDGSKTYNPTGNNSYTDQTIDDFKGTEGAKLNFQLVNDRTYAFVFWADYADSSCSPYTVTFTDNGATVGYTDASQLLANDETLDAFYACAEHKITGDASLNVSLYRPFARINIGTGDFKEAEALGYAPVKSSVSVSNAYLGMDLVSGDVLGDPYIVEFGSNEIGNDEYPTVANGSYSYLAMAYALVPVNQTISNISFSHTDGSLGKEREVTNVPLQRNYNTNIYGNILTSDSELNVEIVSSYWDEFDQDLEETLAKGLKYENGILTVSNVTALRWLSEATNTNMVATRALESIEGMFVDVRKRDDGSYYFPKIILSKGTYDLAGVTDWKPIRLAINGDARGSFDGQGSTIKNLSVKVQNNASAALLHAFAADVNNLTAVNFNLEGNYKVAAIAGEAESAKITNCHVKGATLVSTPWLTNGKYDDANNIGGIAGYALNATIENCSVEDAVISAYRKVGGIVGYSEGAEINNNRITGVKVIADMRETNYDGYATRIPEAGSIHGSATCKSESGNVSSDVTVEVFTSNPHVVIPTVQAGTTVNVSNGQYEAFEFNDSKRVLPDNVTIDCNGAEFKGHNELKFGATTTVKNAKINNTDTKTHYISGQFEGCTFQGDNGEGLYNSYPRSDLKFTDCKFISSLERAFHLGENSYTVVVKGCEFVGYCPVNENLTLDFTDCKFMPNENGYAGFGVRNNATFTNCQFTLNAPYFDHNETAFKAAGKTFILNGCTVNGEAFNPNADYVTVDVEGIVVTIDGKEVALEKTGGKPKKDQ